MKQLSFAQGEYATKRKVTRRERFLGEMEQIVPWAALIAALKPNYFPDAGTGVIRNSGLLITAFFFCDFFTGEDAEAVKNRGDVGARTFP